MNGCERCRIARSTVASHPPPYYGARDYGCVGQIGLEKAWPNYVANLTAVFSEVRRVLTEDRCLFLNLGDCYATGAGTVGLCPGGGEQGDRWKGYRGNHDKDPKAVAIGPITQPNRMPQPQMKPKDLMMMPHRVAIALQEDGWYVRQDNVWVKGNGMPESVKDRTTRSHEYVFHMTKSERYYYDSDAVSEPCQPDTASRYGRGRSDDHKYADGGPGNQTIAKSLDHMNKQDGHGRRHAGFNEREFAGDPRERRNKRSWWLINTQPVKEAHFACMPMAVAETCILAGCPPDGLVLDPFAGAGTTGLAALKHGRNFLGIELNPEYVAIAHSRLGQRMPLFA